MILSSVGATYSVAHKWALRFQFILRGYKYLVPTARKPLQPFLCNLRINPIVVADLD